MTTGLADVKAQIEADQRARRLGTRRHSTPLESFIETPGTKPVTGQLLSWNGSFGIKRPA